MPLTKDQFDRLVRRPRPGPAQEVGWYAAADGKRIGAVLYDRVDGAWGYIVFQILPDGGYGFKTVRSSLLDDCQAAEQLSGWLTSAA